MCVCMRVCDIDFAAPCYIKVPSRRVLGVGCERSVSVRFDEGTAELIIYRWRVYRHAKGGGQCVVPKFG